MIGIINTATSTKGFTDAQCVEYIKQVCANLGIAYELRESVGMPVLPPMPTPANTQVTPAPKPKASKNAKSKLGAKDVAVKLVATKSLVKIDGSVSKDTYAVLKNDADALNGAWDKDAKAFKFNAMKLDGKNLTANAVAKKFATRTVVTGSERDAVRKDWGWA